jgi:hypothetical protein
MFDAVRSKDHNNVCKYETSFLVGVSKKQNVKIDSAASSGGQGKLTSLGVRLSQHCQFFKFHFFIPVLSLC